MTAVVAFVLTSAAATALVLGAATPHARAATPAGDAAADGTGLVVVLAPALDAGPPPLPAARAEAAPPPPGGGPPPPAAAAGPAPPEEPPHAEADVDSHPAGAAPDPVPVADAARWPVLTSAGDAAPAGATGGGGTSALLAEAVRETAEAFAFPLALAALVGTFLLLEHKLDGRDPKLTRSPLTHDLRFE